MKNKHEDNFSEKNIAKKFADAFEKQNLYNEELRSTLCSIEITTNTIHKTVKEIQQNLETTFNMDLSNFIWYLEDEISKEKICHLHHDIMKDCYPDYLRGIFRKEEAWIGRRGCTKEQCEIKTVEPQNIEKEFTNFIEA